jgi:predicted DNA-binding transcriptional regulator AlpA
VNNFLENSSEQEYTVSIMGREVELCMDISQNEAGVAGAVSSDITQQGPDDVLRPLDLRSPEDVRQIFPAVLSPRRVMRYDMPFALRARRLVDVFGDKELDYSPEMTRTLFENVRARIGISKIAELCGVSERSVYRWGESLGAERAAFPRENKISVSSQSPDANEYSGSDKIGSEIVFSDYSSRRYGKPEARMIAKRRWMEKRLRDYAEEQDQK